MKKILKNRLFFFILGVLVTTTSTVLAYSYYAQNIGYRPTDLEWNVDNTKDALDYLKDEYKVVEQELGGKHIESGYIDVSFTRSWVYKTIYFEKPFLEPPTVMYNYAAGSSGGSVFTTNITTTSFQFGLNSFFGTLHSDTIYWVAYGK